MSDKRAFRPVVRYQTGDGEIHLTEKDAQEHAEDKVSKELFRLLRLAEANAGHQIYYRIVRHMIKNHVAYQEALSGLHAFEEVDDDEI